MNVRNVNVCESETPVLIDEQDYEKVRGLKWYKGRNGVFTSLPKDGKWTTVYIHRLILDVEKGTVVRHVNNDVYDCRRHNLIVCTRQESARMKTKSRKVQYKGVTFLRHLKKPKWKAQISDGRKVQNLGHFKSPEEAARVYDRAALNMFGDFSGLNYPKGQYRKVDGVWVDRKEGEGTTRAAEAAKDVLFNRWLEESLRAPRQCVGCGFCCIKAPCGIVRRERPEFEWGGEDGCPELEWSDEEGRYFCGVVKGAEGELKEQCSKELYIGEGCCCGLNSWRSDVQPRREKDR